VRRAHNLLVAGLALLVPAMGKPATAAQIDVVPPTANFPAGMIQVQGELVLEDIDQFRAKASAANKTAIVLLDSPGGSLLAGIRIGKFIRMKSWATAVAADTECASACAFAWLGGTKRFVSATSRIGFHAAYTMAGGRVVESGAGNALLAMYLNELGLSEEAAFYITRTGGDSMQWLSYTDAAKYGIEIEMLTPAVNTAAPAVPPRAEPSLEQRSAAHIHAIVANWSGAIADATNAAQQIYGPQVSYNGKLVSRQEVLADKLKFLARWPQRKYVVRATLATCDDRCQGCSRICTVTGTVDYVASTPTANSQSSAQFEYRILWSDQGPAIIHEAGKMIGRTK
jgi:hypothetical protein